MLELDPFKTGSSGSSTVTVTEKSHGRSASGTVRFRNVVSFDGITKSVMENSSGFTIASVVDTNNYTITVSDTATVGSIRGGGKIASARSCHIGGLMSLHCHIKINHTKITLRILKQLLLIILESL